MINTNQHQPTLPYHLVLVIISTTTKKIKKYPHISFGREYCAKCDIIYPLHYENGTNFKHLQIIKQLERDREGLFQSFWLWLHFKIRSVVGCHDGEGEFCSTSTSKYSSNFLNNECILS